MNQSQRFAATDDVINRFKNGREKYRDSALFNKVVQMLVRGATTYDVIEQLIQATEDTQNAFDQYIRRDDREMVVQEQHIDIKFK